MPDSSIPINLVFEDYLQLAVLEKLLDFSGRNYVVGRTFAGHGYGYIKKRISGFNHAANAMPYFIITDLDDSECAPEKINEWIRLPKSPNLIFRIAVHDVEAWILADRENAANFLGISPAKINNNIEELPRAKRHLLNLIRHSRKSSLKRDMLPQRGSTAKIGPNYNFLLTDFVKTRWDPVNALENSDSLRRAVNHLRIFNPRWRH
jgi:hypothetical protein